ncbi:MAG: flagellar basal body P-ring formation chaperone FlgA [Armatimonadota bacterium]
MPVRIGEIADLQGLASVVEKARNIVVGTGPLPGKNIRIDSKQIQVRMQSELGCIVKMHGSESVLLIGNSIRLNGAQIADVARKYLESVFSSGTDGLRYDVIVERLPNEIVVAHGNDIELKPRLLNPSLTPGPKSVAIDVVVDGKVVATTSVILSVKASAEVLVATRAIQPGELIGPDNSSWEHRDVSRRAGVVLRGEDVTGYQVKRAVAAGSMITHSEIALPYCVRRGEMVSVAVRCGSVLVHTTGEVKQDGRIGDLIRVRPSAASGDVQAKVVGPGLVTIAM